MTVGVIFLTVILTGFGCGIGCGSLSTPLVFGQMIREKRTQKECIAAMLIFTAGKVIMYTFLGILAAVFGNILIDQLQGIYPNITKNLFRLVSVLLGGIMLYEAFHKKNCQGCKQCRGNTKVFGPIKRTSYFVYGILYALMPCSPMLLVLTYAVGFKIYQAGLLLLCFGLANSLFSLIIYAPLLGTIISRMKTELPYQYKWIQAFSAVVIMFLPFFAQLES